MSINVKISIYSINNIIDNKYYSVLWLAVCLSNDKYYSDQYIMYVYYWLCVNILCNAEKYIININADNDNILKYSY